MNNRREDDRILRQISRRRAPRRNRNPLPLWILLGVVIIALITVLCLALLPGRDNTPGLTTDPSDTTVTPEDTSGTAETEKYPGYKEITLSSEDVYRGDLILVNYQYEYVFPDESNIVNIKENKTENYKLANSTLELDARILEIFNGMLADFASDKDRRDVIINSGFRDYESQQDIYTDYVQIGKEDYASVPGHSEHHTGYALDMAVYTDDGRSYTFDQDEDFSWFTHAAHSYGFILRYPEHKSSLTRIAYEPWHFRYVGRPHAYYMYSNDLCLEEYIELLKNYTFDSERLEFRDDEEQLWEIYYVPATGATTTLYVPSDSAYTVSGNNIDGFVVSAEKK